MAVMEEMSAVWREVDHPSGARLEECFDVQVSVCVPACAGCCCCCCSFGGIFTIFVWEVVHGERKSGWGGGGMVSLMASALQLVG